MGPVAARETVVAEGAAVVSTTTHVEVALEASEFGLQVSVDTPSAAGAVRLSPADATDPLRRAVIVTFWLLATALAVAVNWAVRPPAATLTLAGTDKDVLLEEREIVAPDDGAAEFSLAVQAVEPGALTVAGVQLRLDKRTGAAAAAEIVALVPFKASATPPRVAATTFPTVTLVLVES
jgi:hypothetical protein